MEEGDTPKRPNHPTVARILALLGEGISPRNGRVCSPSRQLNPRRPSRTPCGPVGGWPKATFVKSPRR